MRPHLGQQVGRGRNIVKKTEWVRYVEAVAGLVPHFGFESQSHSP